MTAPRALAALVALALAGCGGSEGGTASRDIGPISPSGDRPAGDPSFLVGTTAPADLLLLVAEGDGTVVDGTGTVMLDTGKVAGLRLTGALDAARGRIDLDGGGSILLTDPAATEYVRLAEGAPASGAPFFGVLGIPSLPSDLPGSGAVSYTGRTTLLAVDDLRLYTLSGTAFIVADFTRQRVRIELDGLGGTQQGIATGSVAPADVPATGRIVIDDSPISGAAFSGGRASSSGLPFLLSRDASAADTRGAFFGPGADEVGGRIVVDDPTGSTRVQGSFIAE